ncbi:pectate lyase [candidate division KSB1 bacterium]|nr:pectate lyase [candidate division KSB1 bacterium]
MYKIKRLILNCYSFALLLIPIILFAVAAPAVQDYDETDLATQTRLWQMLMNHEDDWYRTKSAVLIAENIVAYQRESGGWPKNIDFSKPLTKERRLMLKNSPDESKSTIDNGATWIQLFFLARMIHATDEQNYVFSFLNGLDFLLQAQYENGGWPQFYPLRKGYYSHITFNDDAMVGVLRLLDDVVRNRSFYVFVDNERLEKIETAIRQGINCILKTQIRVKGELTAWCAQYDEKKLEPAKGRVYEHISISGKESVGILQYLMSIPHPQKDIVAAVQGGVKWLDSVCISNMRVIREPDSQSPTGFNKIVVSDTTVPCMWARFYQIGTNVPIFSDRDGRIYQQLSQISYERRNNYGWLGYWPEYLLKKQYPEWVKKWSIEANVLDLNSD